MRILIISQYFWPENFRINDLSAELSKRGHDVTVLTGMPNYPEGSLFSDFKKNKAAFSEYNGCQVLRVPMFLRGQGNAVRLFLNYISFALSASLYGPFLLRKRKYDVVFVCQLSPVTVCIPAILFKFLKKAPLVSWVLDLWPESLEAVGVVKSPVLLSVIGRLVSYIYNRCDFIFGQSKAFYEGIARYCTDTRKIGYLPSWSDLPSEGNNYDLPKLYERYKESFKVLFAGNIGDAQDFNSILLAAELAKLKNIDARFFVLGTGRLFEWVESEIIRRGLANYVFLLGRYPLESMPSFYFSSDALLVCLKNNSIYKMTIPGKLQSYMAMGRPVLTMLFGEGSRVVEEADCGFTAESGDYKALIDNILKLKALTKDQLNILGENGIRYTEKHFNREKLISQLEECFLELSGK